MSNEGLSRLDRDRCDLIHRVGIEFVPRIVNS